MLKVPVCVAYSQELEISAVACGYNHLLLVSKLEEASLNPKP
jgi:hypothetical protein